MRRSTHLAAIVVLVLAVEVAFGQSTSQAPDAGSTQPSKTETARDTFTRLPVLRDLALDQKAVVTGPFHLRLADTIWAVPLAGITAGMFTSDAQFTRHLNNTTSRLNNSSSLSNYGVAGFAGAAGGLYLWGKVRGTEKQSSTGYMMFEAMGNATLDTYALKYMFQRQRPTDGAGRGNFFTPSGSQSFPSEHAAIAWSAATVLAHQYPGPLTQLLAYGGATAISVARVTGKSHFSSDVVIGSALGYYVGNQVWRRKTSPEDAMYGTFVRTEADRAPTDMASPYVPLDSWVYAAFDRLTALGYVHTGFANLRPWTRLECARLVSESNDLLAGEEDGAPEAVRLRAALSTEFNPELSLLEGGENYSLGVDSVYTRFTNISGTPLRDGYHFGQTFINDFGRPYGEGANGITGFTSHATAGPLTIFVRGEYQSAPALKPYGAPVLSAIAKVDTQPLTSPIASAGAGDFALLDSYVALDTHNIQFSFGKQSLWWGPAKGGSMMLSNNADPMYMLRMSRTQPVNLPSIFHILGPMRAEFFLGRLSGQHRVNTETGEVLTANSFDPQPFVHGEKLSFKPTENLEFAFSRTTIFGGPNFPFTTKRFLTSMFSAGNSFGKTDPGDRRSGLDFTYRLPKLRNWAQWYADGFTEDEVSPVAYWDRASWRTGIYLPKLPGVEKLDFRAEGSYTDWPIGLAFPGFNYFNVRYLDGYTNRSQLLGDWVGRQGHGLQFWSTYWLKPDSTIQLSYRKQMASPDFLQGGQLDDINANANFRVRADVTVSAGVQYEKWNFPLLAPVLKSNFATTIGITYWPKWGAHGRP